MCACVCVKLTRTYASIDMHGIVNTFSKYKLMYFFFSNKNISNVLLIFSGNIIKDLLMCVRVQIYTGMWFVQAVHLAWVGEFQFSYYTVLTYQQYARARVLACTLINHAGWWSQSSTRRPCKHTVPVIEPGTQNGPLNRQSPARTGSVCFCGPRARSHVHTAASTYRSSLTTLHTYAGCWLPSHTTFPRPVVTAKISCLCCSSQLVCRKVATMECQYGRSHPQVGGDFPHYRNAGATCLTLRSALCRRSDWQV